MDLTVPSGAAELELRVVDPHSYVQVFLVSGLAIEPTTAGDLRARIKRSGVTRIRLCSTSTPATFRDLPVSTYSLCAVILPGDPNDPATAAEEYARGDAFQVVCEFVQVAAVTKVDFTQRTLLLR